ncbi:MAG: phosphatidylglycerophosphatase A [Planctomycetes bacterium]|nr:phosphatidylglycerophosphatase A [Planctomycetota bacterium]
MIRRTIRQLAMTGFGLGYAPVAPGTFGSAGALLVVVVVWGLWTPAGRWPLDAVWAGLTVAAGIACVAWGPWAVEYFAARARKPGDPGHVVIDECAGQWVALIALPLPGHDRWTTALAILAVQFFLFRLFDIVKPPPARQLEKLPAGWGILMDDIAAGLYANLVGQVVFRVIVEGYS